MNGDGNECNDISDIHYPNPNRYLFCIFDNFFIIHIIEYRLFYKLYIITMKKNKYVKQILAFRVGRALLNTNNIILFISKCVCSEVFPITFVNGVVKIIVSLRFSKTFSV